MALQAVCAAASFAPAAAASAAGGYRVTLHPDIDNVFGDSQSWLGGWGGTSFGLNRTQGSTHQAQRAGDATNLGTVETVEKCQHACLAHFPTSCSSFTLHKPTSQCYAVTTLYWDWWPRLNSGRGIASGRMWRGCSSDRDLVEFTDGGRGQLGRRERPHLLFDEQRRPFLLTNGATYWPGFAPGGHGHSFTIAQPIAVTSARKQQGYSATATVGIKSDDLAADLLSLASLRHVGDLTAAEFSAAKRRLLAPPPCPGSPAEYPTLAALTNATTRTGRANRWGHTVPGDGGSGVYAWSAAACSIDDGMGDEGFQVRPAEADSGCWLLQEPKFSLNTMLWGQTDPIFHVAKTGNDVGGDSSCMLRESPCKTIAHALSRNYMVPWGGTSSTDYISIAPGVYHETVGVYQSRLGPAENWPMITLTGSGSSTVIAGDGSGCGTVVANMPGVLNLRNLTLTATANPCQSSIFAQLGGIINVYEGVTFGTANQQDVHSESSGSEVQFWSSYTKTGNATYHLAPIRGAEITYNPIVGLNVRLSGARFSGSFVWGADGGQVYVAATTKFIHDTSVEETWKPFDLMSGATTDMQGAPLASLPGAKPGYMYNGRIVPSPGPPTISNHTGLGSGTAVLTQGHVFAGTIELRPTEGDTKIGYEGKVSVGFNHSLGASSASCSLTAEDGSGQWGLVSLVVTEATEASFTFAWSNGGVSGGGTRLWPQKTYRVVYQCAATCGYNDQCRGRGVGLKTDDGDSGLVLPLPMLGWSTWESFGCFINSTLLEQSIRAMAASPLKAAGYNWILIDDCWTTCKGAVAPNGLCSQPGDRDAAGRPVPDPAKFPEGFEPLTALAHALGLRIGIYTSVSAATCAGYTGAFQHEAADAAAFVEWGFDSVKHDSCGRDYSVNDGSFQAAVSRMRDGIWAAGLAAGRKIVYYLDSGNPTSPQRVFNPYMNGIPAYKDAMEIQQESYLKLARKPEELVWVWATKWGRDSVVADPHDARGRLVDDKGPHMFKSWFDRQDSWASVLTNAQNQIRLAEYQRPSQLHMPDYLTVGKGKRCAGNNCAHGSGAQTPSENRAQFYLWVILAAPLVMGNDIRHMDSFTTELVTSAEVLAVNQDPQCIQGSMVRAAGSGETWIKPLSDGTFAVLLLNKAPTEANATVYFDDGGELWGSGVDFFPAIFAEMQVRDLRTGTDLGVHSSTFTATVPGHDALLLRMEPPSSIKLSNCTNFTQFLEGNQCDDRSIIGAGSDRGTTEECFKWCQETGLCKFFSFSGNDTSADAERAAHGAVTGDGTDRLTPWCVRYTACVPRKVHATNYNSYKMTCSSNNAQATTRLKVDESSAVGWSSAPPELPAPGSYWQRDSVESGTVETTLFSKSNGANLSELEPEPELYHTLAQADINM